VTIERLGICLIDLKQSSIPCKKKFENGFPNKVPFTTPGILILVNSTGFLANEKPNMCQRKDMIVNPSKICRIMDTVFFFLI
jgi:hypothetical protein